MAHSVTLNSGTSDQQRTNQQMMMAVMVMILTALHLLTELRHVVWPYGPEELDVVVTVVLCHLLRCGFVWSLKHKTKQLEEN